MCHTCTPQGSAPVSGPLLSRGPSRAGIKASSPGSPGYDLRTLSYRASNSGTGSASAGALGAPALPTTRLAGHMLAQGLVHGQPQPPSRSATTPPALLNSLDEGLQQQQQQPLSGEGGERHSGKLSLHGLGRTRSLGMGSHNGALKLLKMAAANSMQLSSSQHGSVGTAVPVGRASASGAADPGASAGEGEVGPYSKEPPKSMPLATKSMSDAAGQVRRIPSGSSRLGARTKEEDAVVELVQEEGPKGVRPSSVAFTCGNSGVRCVSPDDTAKGASGERPDVPHQRSLSSPQVQKLCQRKSVDILHALPALLYM